VSESAVSHSWSAESRSARLAAVARRESALFLLATGAIAVHVVDDNFLQPQPGTLAGDHLVSGLVPLAVLALAAATYSHLRAGLRATIALTLGLIGTVAGAGEAGYYTIKIGPSGDDYTGLLAIPAGLLLMAIGVVTLWRTRRLEETRRRRYLRRSLLGAVAAVAAVYVVFPVASSYVYTHVARPIVPAANLGAPYEDVTFTTVDGVELAGWYVPSRNGATVIAFPGRSGPQPHARMLIRHGYGVLLFDPRGEGESEGDPYRWDGERDVNAALAFLAGRRGVDRGRIGGLGLSLGGELLLQAAAESNGLKAVVSDGAGMRSIREHLEKPGARKWWSAPAWVTTTVATAVFSNHAPPPDLTELVSRIAPRPVFFIYSGRPLGGEELNRKFYAAAGEPKTLWKIGDAGHTDGLAAHPREYERRVIAFFDRALLQTK
jgi:uncharacterized protein